jgi:hypothetical protein
MDDRIARLESRVEEIAAALRRLEGQIVELRNAAPRSLEESGPGSGPSAALPPGPAGGPREAGAGDAFEEAGAGLPHALELPWARLVFLAGRTFLVLGGAFLLRALTDLGTLPLGAGLAAGLLYAMLWLAFAALPARGPDALAATFHVGSAVMIAYPLLWEAATRFAVLRGAQTAAALGLVTCLALTVTWARRLRAGAWFVVLAAVAASLALQVETATVEPYVAVLILTGTATLWISHARGWRDLPWLPAIGADLAVLNLVLLASRPGGPPEAYPQLSVTAAPILALALLFVYAGSFAASTLFLKRDVSIFEVVQTILAALAGLGGAARVAEAAGLGSAPLAAVALVLAAGSYAVAFSFKELRWQRRPSFMFFAWQGLVFALAGSRLMVSGLAIDVLWCSLALGAALLGARYGRLTLHFQSVVYAAMAVSSSGLAALSFDSFLGSPAMPWRAPGASSLAALGAAVACFAIAAAAPEDPRRPFASRLPRLLLAIPVSLGAGGLAVLGILALLHVRVPGADPALVASARSAAIAVLAVLLALASRYRRIAELRWLLLALLVIGGMKLIVEDLPHGRPATLFLAFVAYGLALILSPWIVRFRRPAG